MFPSPEAAIESACRLIDDGCDVFGIGTGGLADSIEREEIAGIYAMRARAKSPFGPARARGRDPAGKGAIITWAAAPVRPLREEAPRPNDD